VALHEELGQVDEALKTIEDAVTYYSELKKKGDKDPSSSVTRSDMIQVLVAKSASLAHRYQRYQQAFNSYERLYLETKDEEAKRKYLARVVMAASKVESKIAAKYASKLGTMPGIDQINVKILETQPPPTARSKEDKKESKEGDGDVKMKIKDETKEKAREERLKLRKMKRQAKKRKKRTPKTIDPSTQLDPERWLPKWERSTFKKGKKNKKMRRGGGQGAVDKSDTGNTVMLTGSAILPDELVSKKEDKKEEKKDEKDITMKKETSSSSSTSSTQTTSTSTTTKPKSTKSAPSKKKKREERCCEMVNINKGFQFCSLL